MGIFIKYVSVLAAGILLWPAATPYRLTYPSYFGNRINLREDNPLTVEGIALGRKLFYEKRLSYNNTISCASCHQQSRAFTDGRQVSLGADGTPTKRNSMSLANLLWVRNFFWDGRAFSLEAQAMPPLTDPHEMGQSMDSSISKLEAAGSYGPLFAAAFGAGAITQDGIVKALGQFERTLISAHSPVRLRLTKQEKNDLLAFLQTMTDSAFISDARFSDPN